MNRFEALRKNTVRTAIAAAVTAGLGLAACGNTMVDDSAVEACALERLGDGSNVTWEDASAAVQACDAELGSSAYRTSAGHFYITDEVLVTLKGGS
jgi:hypothetical protein